MLYEGDYAHFMGCDSIFVGASEKGAVFFERCGIAGFNYEGDTSIVVIGNVHQNPELLK